MGEMTFNFPPALMRWIEAQVAEGRYADAGDYLRDLVRRDQDGLLPDCEVDSAEETPEYIAWVREKVAEGLASGVIHRDPRDVLDEIVATRHLRRGEA
ncbi:MAG: type II toxin-antitoxin system ParD family antitoxin [Erythrobacter sp.]|nr:type II toxin-antitoxin system ParD family antitoxin [Erythrobacter sp.]MBA4080100.1 type II toxin-antitoxin system ParD family antitoxin [Erythrobacter sp.]